MPEEITKEKLIVLNRQTSRGCYKVVPLIKKLKEKSND